MHTLNCFVVKWVGSEKIARNFHKNIDSVMWESTKNVISVDGFK